jgi:adenylate cyclase
MSNTSSNPAPPADPAVVWRRRARPIGLAVLSLVLGLYFFGNPLLDAIELKTYDMRQRAHPAGGVPAVAVAAIDEKSLALHGRWPWSRSVLADIVRRLDTLGARVIAFDVFFSEPENRTALEQIERLKREQGVRGDTGPYARMKRLLATDQAFARAMEKNGRVVLPMVFLMTPDEARHQSPADAARALSLVEPHAVKVIRDRGDGQLAFSMPITAGLLANLPELTRAARRTGHINTLVDRDGTVRWSPLVLRHQQLFFPSADLQAVRLYLGDPDLILHTGDDGVHGVQLGERFIATDEFGRVLIHYRGGTGSFPTFSVADLLAGRIDAETVRGRIVLIGATATGLGDMRATPAGAVFPGVEIRANTIQNLLDGDFIHRPGWMFVFDLATMLLLGLLLAWLLPRLGLRTSAVVTLGLAIAYLVAASLEFRFQQVWLVLTYPLLLLALLFVSTTLVHYFIVEREKRGIKRAFQHYIAPAVVERILDNPDNLGLGGEKRELTVLFADIRGFTAIAESLPPETLVLLLNEYLTRMTEQVFRHEGLLDKYIGDAILAVYGAPIAHPDHAVRACRTALDLVRAAGVLQAEWKAQGLPGLDLGVGINTGPMIVGNMGSKTRFDYTVIGDAVNLGSRIEALNRKYGTHILLSELTCRQVKDEFLYLREIDVTTVRGRNEPVRLFELMLPERHPHMDWLKEFSRAYEQFHAGQPGKALPAFQKLADDLNDPVSRYYSERCQSPRRRRGD